MSKKLFIGNIDWNATQDELQALFAPFGETEECVIVTDKFSGRSKGFGFVSFTNDADADKAVEALNGTKLKNRDLVVNEARPPKERPPRRDY